MSRTARTIVAIALALGVATAAQLAGGQAFRPAAAADAQPPAQVVAAETEAAPGVDVLDGTAPGTTPEATPAPVVRPTAEPTTAPAPVEAPPATVASTEAAPAAPAPVVAAAAPVTRPAAAPAPTAAPAAPVAPPPAPAPTTCPATWFCYPRLGIAGAIVPYTDCGGSTDIGTSIRSFACLPPLYLMGHAYTQFGLITQWRAGDVVFANGRQYTISGAFTQSSCQAPARVPAPLSLQTSLTSTGCGSVLVVQGN